MHLHLRAFDRHLYELASFDGMGTLLVQIVETLKNERIELRSRVDFRSTQVLCTELPILNIHSGPL